MTDTLDSLETRAPDARERELMAALSELASTQAGCRVDLRGGN